jgi:hypothetical protein
MSNTDKIKNLEAEIAKLKVADDAFNALSPEKQLAITLHGLLCHWNHVDGCSWEYEGDKNGADWGGSAHESYLEKANKVHQCCKESGVGPGVVIKILKIVQEF